MSSLPECTESANVEPIWESGPAHSSVQQGSVEISKEQAEALQTSCKQSTRRNQESVLPFGYNNSLTLATGEPSLNRWPDVDCRQVRLSAVPAVANQLLQDPCRKKQAGPQQHTTRSPGPYQKPVVLFRFCDHFLGNTFICRHFTQVLLVLGHTKKMK